MNTAVRRYDKWTTLNNTNTALDQTFDPQWIADLDIGYKADAFVKGLKFNLGRSTYLIAILIKPKILRSAILSNIVLMRLKEHLERIYMAA